MTVSGSVQKWIAQKGCGFIKGDNGEDYFVHRDALVGGNRLEHDGRVTFDVEKGRPRRDMRKAALNVSGPGVAAPTQGKLVGTVGEWYPARGYGFIVPTQGRDKVYVHSTAFDGACLVVNKTVFFDAADVDHRTGRKVAINVSGGAVKPQGSCRCIVKKWIADKGYGFVEDVSTGDEIFVHASSIGDGAWLEEGKEVYCDTQKDRKTGKQAACNVSGYAIRDAEDPGYDAGYGGGYNGGYSNNHGYNNAPAGRGATYAKPAAGGAGGGKAGGPEKRADTDGCLYTRAEFVAHYGGAREWDEKEKRISPANGHAYTKEKFMAHFGGLDEWNKAKKSTDGAPAPVRGAAGTKGSAGKGAGKGAPKGPVGGGSTIVGRGGGKINLGGGGKGAGIKGRGSF